MASLQDFEELEKKVNAFIATSDEQRRINLNKAYEEFKKKYQWQPGTTPETPPPVPLPPIVKPTITAHEEGISGIKAFKIDSISPAEAIAAVDGKRSTAFKGSVLSANLGGIGEVYGLAIKFKDGPYDYKVEASFDGTTYAEVPILASTFEKNQFDIFEFGTPLITQYIRISSASVNDIEITTIEALGELVDKPEIPVPKPEPEPTPTPQPTPTTGQDQFGITMMCATAPGGKNITEMGYKRSSHNTGTRDTFSKKGADFMPMEVSGYYKTSLSDNEEELSYKIWGGTHSDGVAKQGQCMSFGMEQVGTPSFKKEYPKHPDTPDFSNDVDIVAGMDKKQRSFKGKWTGLKGIAWIDKSAKKAFFKMYIDTTGMVNGKPANDWKLWYTYYDDGKNLEGPAFMENQGVKNGGDGIFYMRIDTVTDKTDTYGLSCREIVPPTS